MSRAANPFRPAVVAGLLLVGAAAFLLLLYAIGAGWDGQQDRDGGAHAGSNSLNGYSALVDLLERRGFDVSLSRSPARLNDEALLVITPSQFANAEQIGQLIEDRQNQGPTLLILPKWTAASASNFPGVEAKDGWVVLAGASPPRWLGEIEAFEGIELSEGKASGWQGLSRQGELPDPDVVQAVTTQEGPTLLPIISDNEGDLLVGYWNQNGYFPSLAYEAGVTFSNAEEKDQNPEIWPLVVVAEPDLLNNYGLADQQRARMAISLITASLDGYEMPIIFDLTIPGLASSDNLLTLAFRPPFLAATLCLLLAAMVIGWRAFRRFGPPVAEAPALARGKVQLARNGAALIERAKRWHLLGEPYAALVSTRIAKSLNISETDADLREAEIDQAIAARDIGGPQFSRQARTLRAARRPAEIIRAASALRQIERMLIK